MHRLQSYGSAVTHSPLVPPPTEWDGAAWVREPPEFVLVRSKGPPCPSANKAVDGILECSIAKDNKRAQALHPTPCQLHAPSVSSGRGNRHGAILMGLSLRTLLGKSCCCCPTCAGEENLLRWKAEEEEGVELGELRKVAACLRGEARDELEEQDAGRLCLHVCRAHRLQKFKFPGPEEMKMRECGSDRAGYPPQFH